MGRVMHVYLKGIIPFLPGFCCGLLVAMDILSTYSFDMPNGAKKVHFLSQGLVSGNLSNPPPSSCSTCKCACRSSSHSADTERNSTRRTYTRSALHVVPRVCCSPAHSRAGCSRPARLKFCYTCGPWSPSRPTVGPPNSNLVIC